MWRIYTLCNITESCSIAIENRIYREEFTRKKCKTAILLYVLFPYCREYHFIENLKLLLKESQIMK